MDIWRKTVFPASWSPPAKDWRVLHVVQHHRMTKVTLAVPHRRPQRWWEASCHRKGKMPTVFTHGDEGTHLSTAFILTLIGFYSSVVWRIKWESFFLNSHLHLPQPSTAWNRYPKCVFNHINQLEDHQRQKTRAAYRDVGKVLKLRRFLDVWCQAAYFGCGQLRESLLEGNYYFQFE